MNSCTLKVHVCKFALIKGNLRDDTTTEDILRENTLLFTADFISFFALPCSYELDLPNFSLKNLKGCCWDVF